MVIASHLPSLSDLKIEAKKLRSEHESKGLTVTHSECLEAIALQYGFKDWNTLSAKATRQDSTQTDNVRVRQLRIGMIVSGHYLKQAFTGKIIKLTHLDDSHTRLTLDFNEPVDVVASESFSAFRKRVNCTLDKSGQTDEKLSDGTPQLVLGSVSRSQAESAMT